MSRQRILGTIAAVLVLIFILLVAIGTVGAQRTNPPVSYTIQWDSLQTEKLVRDSCFACHSNETQWPWYAYVAPAAFLISHDVQEGREKMNFSTGHKLEADDMIEEIEGGDMPLPNYVMMHPEANLNEEQKAQLIAGIEATFGEGRGGERGKEAEEEKDND